MQEAGSLNWGRSLNWVNWPLKLGIQSLGTPDHSDQENDNNEVEEEDAEDEEDNEDEAEDHQESRGGKSRLDWVELDDTDDENDEEQEDDEDNEGEAVDASLVLMQSRGVRLHPWDQELEEELGRSSSDSFIAGSCPGPLMPSEAEQVRYIREAISNRPGMSRLLTKETRQHIGLYGAMDSPPAGLSGTFVECPAAPLLPINPTVPPAPRNSYVVTIAPALTMLNTASISPPSTTSNPSMPITHLSPVNPIVPLAPGTSDDGSIAPTSTTLKAASFSDHPQPPILQCFPRFTLLLYLPRCLTPKTSAPHGHKDPEAAATLMKWPDCQKMNLDIWRMFFGSVFQAISDCDTVLWLNCLELSLQTRSSLFI
ncbi:hypothetical protein B9Z19DRAFT_1138798 [Tuber borchii]|uniref:Uncharacterized protein n=1 Tax=Tuber borchii TaxID=42251 RepID=A0A2T6Z9U8_TUBBO|nr:hypothetical protein B9Z19DRAFT_1138798 [Tuber borchii]